MDIIYNVFVMFSIDNMSGEERVAYGLNCFSLEVTSDHPFFIVIALKLLLRTCMSGSRLKGFFT